MSSSKKFQILLILLFAFWGSFFIVKNTLANEVQSPIVLNAFLEDYGDVVKIKAEGLVSLNKNVLVYINQKYYSFADIKKIDDEINGFYFESDFIKKEGRFEIMLISRDKNSLFLSSPTVLPVKSVFVKNMADSIETLAENQEKKVMLAKNLTSFEKKDEILAKNLSIASDKKTSLILDKKISAPTLISPTFKDAIGTPKPLITGLANSNAFVHFYIDGVYNGKTGMLTHLSGVANFAYKPFLNLPVGRHEVWTVAENSLGQKSGRSKSLYFIIEHPMPAPTLLTPYGRIQYPANLFISGLAKNNSFIKVFIDNQLEKAFLIKNDPSGVGNFAYSSKMALNRGSHLVYTTATDNRSKESKWSNIKRFTKYKPRLIATTAEEDILGKTSTTGPASISVESISNIPGDSKKEVKGEEASLLARIKEKEDEKNKFQLNLTIFLVFLVVIIVWMFLVNKGLKGDNNSGERKL